jgi:hypothetical protein
MTSSPIGIFFMETGGACPNCDFIGNEKLNYRASKENRA